MKRYAGGHVVEHPGASPSECGDTIGQYGIALQVLRTLGLWVGIAFTSFGIVSLFIPESAWSLLYLVGFPLLCLMLFVL
jgi:hypothetical protein